MTDVARPLPPLPPIPTWKGIASMREIEAALLAWRDECCRLARAESEAELATLKQSYLHLAEVHGTLLNRIASVPSAPVSWTDGDGKWHDLIERPELP